MVQLPVHDSRCCQYSHGSLSSSAIKASDVSSFRNRLPGHLLLFFHIVTRSRSCHCLCLHSSRKMCVSLVRRTEAPRYAPAVSKRQLCEGVWCDKRGRRRGSFAQRILACGRLHAPSAARLGESAEQEQLSLSAQSSLGPCNCLHRWRFPHFLRGRRPFFSRASAKRAHRTMAQSRC